VQNCFHRDVFDIGMEQGTHLSNPILCVGGGFIVL
jgi:hypothetical protein